MKVGDRVQLNVKGRLAIRDAWKKLPKQCAFYLGVHEVAEVRKCPYDDGYDMGMKYPIEIDVEGAENIGKDRTFYMNESHLEIVEES